MIPAYDFTPEQVEFVRANFETMTHKELYDVLVPDGAIKLNNKLTKILNDEKQQS